MAMKLVGGLIGGAIAGLLGAIAWAAVGYFTNYELGILAWGIGVLVGFGAKLGSQREGGPALGLVAALIAVGSILLGKWMWVSLMLGSSFDDEYMIADVAGIIIEERREAGQPVPPLRSPETSKTIKEMYPGDLWREAERRWNAYSVEEQEGFRKAPSMLNADLPLVYLADDVCSERINAGETIDWPDGHTFETAVRQAHYPEDIWSEAVGRWEEFTPVEQDQFVAGVRQEQEARFNAMATGLQPTVFFQSFEPFDILWAILALVSAFQIAGARGAGSSESENDSDNTPPVGY